MADNENDMTGNGASTARENAATRRARSVGIDGLEPPSAAAIGKAVADALERQRNAPPPPERPLPEVVRASCRAGYETYKKDANTVVTKPASITFGAHETADGRETTVMHGKPVRLKREAFIRYLGTGQVEFGQ